MEYQREVPGKLGNLQLNPRLPHPKGVRSLPDFRSLVHMRIYFLRPEGGRAIRSSCGQIVRTGNPDIRRERLEPPGTNGRPGSTPESVTLDPMTISNWLDNRTGYRAWVVGKLRAPVPGAPRWERSLLAGVVFLFAVQLFTGLLLMLVYAPFPQSAWGSVWYIQTKVPSGWLIRGLHHFASAAMLVLLALLAIQMILTRRFRAPREIVWWITLCLLGLTLGLSLSGHPLPWDQDGYWGTKVRTNILAKTPIIGNALKRLLLGGNEPGRLTLTRLYALHVVILPLLIALLLIWRRRLCRRTHAHSRTAGSSLRDPPRTEDLSHSPPANESVPEESVNLENGAPYYPSQCIRDTIACAATFAATFAASLYVHYGLGYALLSAPADPAAADYPARPEWHTLFLFQWLKYFEGPTSEVIGAIIVPGAVTLLFFLFPFIHRAVRPRIATAITGGTTVALGVAVCWLTAAALRADRNPSDDRLVQIRKKQARGESLSEAEQAVLQARQFNVKRNRAHDVAKRALQLAAENGIPPRGPLALLRSDPLTRGPELFAAHCATCHRFNGHDGLGAVPAEPADSSDLAGYASQGWIRGLIEDPMADRYFGRMTKPNGQPAHTRMERVVADLRKENQQESARRELEENFDAVAAYLEDESWHPGRLADLSAATDETSADASATADDHREAMIRRGRRYFMSVCNECHSYEGERSGFFRAPEMYGYGSVAWIEKMIANPADDSRYGSKGKGAAQMPAFQERLSKDDRLLIAQWLHDVRKNISLRNSLTATGDVSR